MLHLDSGCLLKLYFPEPNSRAVIAAVRGERLALTPLHELELTTGLQLKVFRKEATAAQVAAALAGVEEDIRVGKLIRTALDWVGAFELARLLAARHSAATGCRALDAFHCALAQQAGLELLSTDARQLALARAAGIRVREV